MCTCAYPHPEPVLLYSGGYSHCVTLPHPAHYRQDLYQPVYANQVYAQPRPIGVYADTPMDVDEPPFNPVLYEREREHERATQQHGYSIPSGSTAHPSRTPTPNNAPIYFYNRGDPYYEFTNFSDHAIQYDHHTYQTAEHLYQALKFLKHHPATAAEIRGAPSARRARAEAARLRRLARPDWFDVNVRMMERVLQLKFGQHPALARALLGTGARELVEDSPDDAFWGVGREGTGRNELGKALMRLRANMAANSR